MSKIVSCVDVYCIPTGRYVTITFMKSKELYLKLAEYLKDLNQGCSECTIRRSPAICANDKKVLFYSTMFDKVVFLLEKDLPEPPAGLIPFNPFKNKPPINGWYVLTDSRFSAQSKEYARRALDYALSK